MEVRLPAESLQRAPTPAVDNDGLVTERDVQEDQGHARPEGRKEQGVRPQFGCPIARTRLHQRVEVLQEMEVVRGVRGKTPVADPKGVDRHVPRLGEGAHSSDFGQPRAGQRLAVHGELGPVQIDAGRPAVRQIRTARLA